MICSESKLDDEVKFITQTLCNNGFPEAIVWSVIRDKISDFSKIKPDSVLRCPVYLRLPWLSDKFTNQISACIRKCYFSSNLCGLPHTDCFDIWLKRSSLIYSFICVCRLQYIRRTNQCLDSRIKQHVPTKIQQGKYFADRRNNTYGSSIAEHLINNCNCASSYSADLLTILSKSHSDYHLRVLETIHILTHQPSLVFNLPPPFLVNLLFFLSSTSLHSPCPFSFLIVLILTVISEDQNRLFFYFLKEWLKLVYLWVY